MLNDLDKFVAIDTTQASPSADNAPFGDNLRKALDLFLDTARGYGLRVGENGGYYGWAEYGDPDAPIIGLAAHIDIVPAGGGWTDDPFKLRDVDGKLYGRGVADDKGPMVAMLHVLKTLRDESAALKHRVRLIVGCNEETGSLCLKKYAAEGEIPVVTLVPDSDFPCINSEKGILHTDAFVPADSAFADSVIKLDGGDRRNVVPAEASVLLRYGSAAVMRLSTFDSGLTENMFSSPEIAAKLISVGARPSDMSVSHADDGLLITAAGTAGHGSEPDKADNALWKIFAFLSATLHSSVADAVFERICCRNAAEKIGVYCEDEDSGALTMNLGAAHYAEGNLTLMFDFRLPLSADPDDVESKLTAALCEGTVIKRDRFADNLFIPPASPLIRTLLSVYAEVTGTKDPQPIRTGGGTYARELPSAVAFGPTFPGTETNIHNADENIPVADLYKLRDIYLTAIKKLDELYK